MIFCLIFEFSWGFWLLLYLQIFSFVVDFLGAAQNFSVNLLFLVLAFLVWAAGQGGGEQKMCLVACCAIF